MIRYFKLLPLTIIFLAFIQCTEPPEPEVEITIFPNPASSTVVIDFELPQQAEISIYLYGGSKDFENPVEKKVFPAGNSSLVIHLNERSGAYLMDVLVDGKAKRFKIFVDESL